MQDSPPAEHRFPCDQCGNDLRFDPVNNQMICDYCGNAEAITSGPWKGATLRELEFNAASADQLPEDEIEETRVVKCANCGAQFEFDAAVHAAECPFCATPIVTDTGTSRHIKPRGVLPFSIEERVAHKAMSDWLAAG